MSVSNTTAAALTCGACQHTNSLDAQFCGGCGHGLREKCRQCNAEVTLTQKFCVGCGEDLAAWLAHRIEAQERKLSDAVEAAKSHDYERSLAIFQSVASLQDFRFASARKQASLAKEKVETLRAKVISEAGQRIADAKQAHAQNNLAKAVKLLAQVPDKLMDEEAIRIRQNSHVHLEQTKALQTELQQRMTEKNYVAVAGLLAQLLELEPGNERYQQLSQQVGDKLLRRADRSFARLDYTAAGHLLDSLPSLCHTDTFKQLRHKVDLAQWLSTQIDKTPFATNALGRLAVRLSKECPSDGNAADSVKKLAAEIKSQRPSPRDAHAVWKKEPQSWLGGRIGVLGQPTSIQWKDVEGRPASMAPFAVAIGLALHALGRTRVGGNLITKKGLISKLGLNKAKSVWGIDIGSAAIAAVKMRIDKGNELPIVEAIQRIELKQPTCRGGSKSVSELIPEAVRRLLETIEISEATVYSNLPANDAIARFCELPPVKDKEADKLIEAEVRGRIPIPTDDLALLTWLAPISEEGATGRPVVMSAATKIAVERRVDLIKIGGLQLDGLVPDTIALANFAAYEFADVLSPSGTNKKTKKKGDEEQPPEEEPTSITVAGKQPTLAIVDAGASKTTLLLITPISIWFWSHESGGEDATAAVARQTKLTAEDAEQAKRNLATMDSPHEIDEQVQAKQEIIRARLVKLREEADKTFRHFDVQTTWCVGAAHQQHGFIQRVLMR